MSDKYARDDFSGKALITKGGKTPFVNSYCRGICRDAVYAALLPLLIIGMLISSGCTRSCTRDGGMPVPSPEEAAGENYVKEKSLPLNNADDIKKALDAENINEAKARDLLEPLLQANPGDPSLLLLKSRLLWSKGDLKTAHEIADAVLLKEPENRDALAFKATMLMDHFRNDDAASFIDRLQKAAPGWDQAQLLKARLLLKTWKYDRAEALLKSMIKKHPDNLKAYNALIDVYDESLDIYGGMRFIQNALNRKWEDPKIRSFFLTRLGELIERQGRMEVAVKYFEKALEEEPENTLAGGKLAMCLIHMDDIAGARIEVEKAAKDEENLDNPFPLYAKAQLLMQDARFSQAEDCLRRAIKKFPLEITGYHILGYFLLHYGQYREAQKMFAHAAARRPGDFDAMMGEILLAAIRRDPGAQAALMARIPPLEHRYAEYYLRLGDIYLHHLRDTDKAEFYYEKALKDREQGQLSIMPPVGLGEIELKRGRDEEAMKQFGRALARSSETPFIYPEVIDTVIENKRFDMAEKYMAEWEKSNKTAKSSSIDISSMYLQFANAYENAGNAEAAGEMVRKAGEAYPDAPMLDSHLAKVALMRGDKEKAKRHLLKFVTRFPEEGISWLYLGVLAGEEGDGEKARTYSGRAGEIFLTPGFGEYEKAWVYSLMRNKEAAVKELRKACEEDIFNSARAYAEDSFDWMRDDPFFKNELPGLIKHIKDKTPVPQEKDLEW
ncbi:MAG: tetratricopeptide repeat protein [Chloroflexi bacterium]|nr:tetratricopeptide repeat protein [Chloroflexota bacterium]